MVAMKLMKKPFMKVMKAQPMKSMKSQTKTNKKLPPKATRDASTDDDAASSTETDAGDARSTATSVAPRPAEPRSAGEIQVHKWAELKAAGQKCTKPHLATQWTMDQLKKLDKQEGGDRHQRRYTESSSTLAKSQISMKLALDRKSYYADMRAWETNSREQNIQIDIREGWMTLGQICDLEKITGDDKEEKALELLADMGSDSKPHPVKKWADRGEKLWYFKSKGPSVRSDKRTKQVGFTKFADINTEEQADQEKYINDAMDKDWESLAGPSHTASTSSAPTSGKRSKTTKEDKAAQKVEKAKDNCICMHVYMYQGG